ncbi:MAG: hypothetical protein GY832_15910 [Chloroflexi bacterium]|nr:hypothetical protein [Chloroflexota bacterium]
MLIQPINDDIDWKRLLSYAIDYVHQENRLHLVIEQEDIPRACWFLPHVDGSFLRDTSLFSFSIQRSTEEKTQKLQRFVLRDMNGGKQTNICFGYPFFVDSDHNLMPLLYVGVSGQQTDKGVSLTSTNTRVKINSAALQSWDSASHLSLETKSGRVRFDQALDQFLSTIEGASGEPAVRVSRKEFQTQQLLSRHTVVECPVLFYAQAGDANHLLRELSQLKEEHRWNTLQPGLHHLLLNKDDREPYPETLEPNIDQRRTIVPANNSQRKAVTAAGQYPLTVVTAPPGANRSQLVLNIVGDAVFQGKTILVASPDSEITDAVFEHFSTQLNYPGIVQSGEEFRPQMLSAMRRALSDVRKGGVTSNLEQAHGEYNKVARLIDEQKTSIALAQQLESERASYRLEIQTLLDTLPETVRACVRKDRIRFGQDNEQALTMAIATLLQDVQNRITQHQTLAENVRQVLVANQQDLPFLRYLEDAEQQLGAATSLRRPDVDLNDLPAITDFMSAWENLLKALVVEENAQQLRTTIANTESQDQPDLSGDLWAALDSAVDTFDQEREQVLRQDIQVIQSEAHQAALSYRTILEKLNDFKQRSEVVTHWLLGAMAVQADDSTPRRLEDILDRAFAIKDNVLHAHRLGTARAGLAGVPDRLRQDRDSKTTKLEDLLDSLEKQVIAARTRVPALLLPKVATAIKVANHTAWQNLAAELDDVNTWATRIASGKLTPQEQVRGIISRDWAIKQLRQKLKDISTLNATLLALNPVEEPPRKVSFKFWADYVQMRYDFVQACALSAHQANVRQTLASHQAQSDSEIDTKSTELSETETQFADSLTQLPETIAEAMSNNTWPFGPINESIVRDLDVLQEQYQHLKTKYTGWEERLAALERDHTLPEALQSAIQGLLSDGKRQTAQGTSWVTSMSVLKATSIWLRFSQATGIEYELRELHPNLAEAETSLDVLWAKLPDGMRQELEWSKVMPSKDLIHSMQQYLVDLNTDVNSHVEDWNRIRGRATALLHQNELNSPVLSKALKKAQKDPNYLTELFDETYEHSEQLVNHLQIWQQIIQIWHLRAQRTRAGAKLKELPSQDQAQPALDQLWQQQTNLGGQLLTEQWRHVAAALEPDTLHAIDQYLSAIETSTNGGNGSSLNAEGHYTQALKLFPVWLIKNLSTQGIPLQPGIFDTILIDAASQCDIPSTLPLLFRGKRIVMIGDEDQPDHIAALPDSVTRQLAERHNIEIDTSKPHSLFDLAASIVTGGPGHVRL